MKLNREQEEILIQIGLDTLLKLRKPIPTKPKVSNIRKKSTSSTKSATFVNNEPVVEPEKKIDYGWTPERRAKFSRMMKRRWRKKKQDEYKDATK